MKIFVQLEVGSRMAVYDCVKEDGGIFPKETNGSSRIRSRPGNECVTASGQGAAME